jgi:hypothetical protein
MASYHIMHGSDRRIYFVEATAKKGTGFFWTLDYDIWYPRRTEEPGWNYDDKINASTRTAEETLCTIRPSIDNSVRAPFWMINFVKPSEQGAVRVTGGNC